MRLVFVNSEGTLGGAERCLLDLFSSLASELPGAAAHLVCLAPGPFPDEARRMGIPVTILPLPESLARAGDTALKHGGVLRHAQFVGSGLRALGAAPLFAASLRRTIEAQSPTLIHSNSIKTHLLLRLATRLTTPVIWHVHDFAGRRPVARNLLRWTSSGAAGIIANSRAVAADIARLAPAPPIAAVLNGIDTDVFSPGAAASAELDAAAGLSPAPAGTLRIGLVATYARWKGHCLFLDAAREALSAGLGNRARFYIIGGPIYRTQGSQVGEAELREHARRLGIADRVGFVGFQNEPAAAYRALDVVVHASTEPEPFGRTIAEAMACGKAVIVAAAGGAKEIVTDGKDALTFTPGDAPGLARLMVHLASDETMRRRLGTAARATVLSRFTRRRYAAEVGDFYRHVVERARRPALVVAMGYIDDNWHSSRNLTAGLADSLRSTEAVPAAFRAPHLHAPRLFRAPRWADRRVRYPRTIPSGGILHLMDHSYGDAILAARDRFDATVVVIQDVAFWRARTAKNAWFRERILRGLAAADRRIASSHAVAEQLRREAGIEADCVIYPGVPVERFPHSSSARDPHLLLHVGSADERKGLDRAIRLLARLPPPFRLLHVGGTLGAALESLAAQLGVARRVSTRPFVGLEQLVACYQEAGALLFPSRYEGFGLPVIEARLCGTPAVVSDAVPAIELLREDPGTMLLDFGAFDEGADHSRVRRAAEVFLASPRKPIALAERERFGWERAAVEYAAVYQDLLSGLDAGTPARAKTASSAPR